MTSALPLPNDLMLARTLDRVPGEVVRLPVSTEETVLGETPACHAISAMVTTRSPFPLTAGRQRNAMGSRATGSRAGAQLSQRGRHSAG
jgi:hypothetical protein